MNDIEQSQENSIEGQLQFLLKVRGLKSKSFRNKVRSTNGILWGGVGLQNKTDPWREHGYFLELHTIVRAKCKLFHFLWKYGQIDEAN